MSLVGARELVHVGCNLRYFVQMRVVRLLVAGRFSVERR